MEIYLDHISNLELAAQKLLETFPNHRIWALSGEMGAGKTTFVSALGNYLKLQDAVSSPTFPIIQEYRFSSQETDDKRLIHMDLYRLKSLEEALDIGIEEYLDSKHLLVIEWPDLILPLIDGPYLAIQFSFEANGGRKIVISSQHPL